MGPPSGFLILASTWNPQIGFTVGKASLLPISAFSHYCQINLQFAISLTAYQAILSFPKTVFAKYLDLVSSKQTWNKFQPYRGHILLAMEMSLIKHINPQIPRIKMKTRLGLQCQTPLRSDYLTLDP